MIFKPLEFEEFKGNGFDTFKIKMRSNRKDKFIFNYTEIGVIKMVNTNKIKGVEFDPFENK